VIIKYKNLLSPIKVGNMVLKNRFVASNSLPHFLQGPETWPSEQVIEHVVSLARNGAAVVTFADWTNKNQRNSFNEDGKRFPMFDIDDPSVQNYFCQLAEQVHYYDSRISIAIMPFAADFPGYDVSYLPPLEVEDVDSVNLFFMDGEDQESAKKMVRFSQRGEQKEFTREMIKEIIEQQVQRIKFYKDMGFDMCTLHFAYRLTLFARFLSPLTNTRTDEYGGSLENRCRFMKELCTRIKEVCGRDFPIEIQISGGEEEVGGYTVEDFIEIARQVEDVVDIFQIRAGTANLSHPTCWNSREHEYETLRYAEALKKSGVNILAEVVGGYQVVDEIEEILASGKADLIGGARLFFCDPEYYQKILEGRGEDVVPCVRCNKCHVPSLTGKWLSICTINPKLGIAHKLDKMVAPAGRPKKVAIVGGGPAGMRTSLFCAERGHDVTVYEKKSRLGGQLYHADYASFKWPLKRYRDYLEAQMKKMGVKVLLNTEATPETIKAGNYDVVILALGAEPIMPPIAGIENCKWNVLNVYGNEDKLGRKVVVVGGSESGVETALYLAENGHDVTVLSRKNVLAYDATPIHYRETIVEFWQTLPNFHYIKNATTTETGGNFVKYIDKDGNQQAIQCDDVVVLGGMRPLQEEAMAFYGSANRMFMIGDCREIGSVRECNRTAFAAASQI
jgi:2,4-dienoyl-CoA reductase-like NADH-dependent reductase (Old Yellow Enzyme family)/thioredoxin reductase